MLISNLQQFIRLLVPPLSVAGINQSSQKSVAVSLEELADSLEPFKEMSADQLTDLLKAAKELRETGNLPDWVVGRRPKASKPKSEKPGKAPKMTTIEAVAKLRDLQQRSSQLDPGQITSEMRIFNELTGLQLKEVQREFLGVVTGKNKSDQITSLQHKIEDFRASKHRVDGILAL